MLKIIFDGATVVVSSKEIEEKVKAVVFGSTVKRQYHKRKYKDFTDVERQAIADGYQKGLTSGSIAKAIGRSQTGVYNYARRNGLIA